MFGVKLSMDECNLLYLLIFKSFAENALNIISIIEWVKVRFLSPQLNIKSHKGRRLKTLIHMTDVIGEIQQKIEKKIEMPEIFSSIVKVITEVGFAKLEHSIDFITNKSIILISIVLM